MSLLYNVVYGGGGTASYDFTNEEYSAFVLLSFKIDDSKHLSNDSFTGTDITSLHAQNATKGTIGSCIRVAFTTVKQKVSIYCSGGGGCQAYMFVFGIK